MWEFYTARDCPYPGLSSDAIAQLVYSGGKRPVFPKGVPRDYASLAAACWAASPKERCSVEQLAGALGRLRAAHEPEAAAGGAAAAARGGAAPAGPARGAGAALGRAVVIKGVPRA